MVTLIQGIWVFLIIFLLFYRHKYGLALYLAYLILVPYMKIHLGVILQWNLVNLIVLASSLLNFYRLKPTHKYDCKPLYPFIVYFAVSLMMMPFQKDMQFNEMFTILSRNFHYNYTMLGALHHSSHSIPRAIN